MQGVFYLIKILPISTKGIIERLVIAMISHWVPVIVTKLKSDASGEIKYTHKISVKRATKLKLKNLLFSGFIVNRLFSVLQFNA